MEITVTDQTNETDQLPLTENFPARVGELSALASAHAPFLYFDTVPSFGVRYGVANVTLEAFRFIPSGTEMLHDRVAVAHLRMSLDAARILRDALNGVLLAATPKPPEGASH